MARKKPADQHFGKIVGTSPRMREVFEMVEKVAATDVSVLIVGETGTGKELIAWEIHQRSARCDAPFLAVNTGALSKQLIASELFGHVKGAFTGAAASKAGRFAEAHGGTLFLDEIATMDEEVQIALLRVLEIGKLRPVGAKRDRSVDVRLIAATNSDLRQSVTTGAFRQDLLHRLEVFRITVPPLREHVADIPVLAEHFLDQCRADFELGVTSISGRSIKVLQSYAWPGNIRELRNVIAQAAVMAQEGKIKPEHLPERLKKNRKTISEPIEPVEGPAPVEPPDTETAVKTAETSARAPSPSTETDEAPTQEGVFIPLGSSLEEVQKAYVMKTLAFCANNKTHAARVLGISRKTLHDKLVRWNTGT